MHFLAIIAGNYSYIVPLGGENSDDLSNHKLNINLLTNKARVVTTNRDKTNQIHL